MKRIFTIAAAVMLLVSPAANAQNILGRLGNAVSKKISEKVTEKVADKVKDKVEDKIAEKTGVDVSSMEDISSAKSMPVPDSQETLPSRRSSTFGWDEVVAPSSASFPIPLMNEFPAVPSASQLANPTEADQIAFYRAIKAVTLRAEELNASTTCEDVVSEKFRKELEDAVKSAFGLSDAEYQALQDGTMTEAEQEKLAERMKAKILGGYSEEQLMAEAQKAENMSEASIESRTLAATCAVFDKHAAELPKYTGCTAEEYKQASRESVNSDDSAASRAIEKKADAYINALPADQKKEARAFMNVLKKELMNAALDATPGARLGLQIANNVGKMESEFGPIFAKYQKIEKYAKDIYAAIPFETTFSNADAVFSQADRKKVEGIKSAIYATDNPNEYNPLYLQAIELIKTYRERAAKVWAADVQNRFNKVKTGMGEVIKINRQAIADEIIPECALWRVPLNCVIQAGDILAEAYSEFPDNYPHMYDEDVQRELKLEPDERKWWPEFYVSTELDNVLSGKNMFKEKNGEVYQFNGGSWTKVGKEIETTAAPQDKKPASASFVSSDGKREVIYNAEGGFFQFPEGDIVYPVAWDKRGSDLIWAEINTVVQQDGSVLYKIVKCTYKL